MIQDLHDMDTLGRRNPGPLEQIGFDMTLLDQAKALVDECAPLYAEAKRDREQAGTAKTIRDQAFTHLREAVDEIRKYGRYIFRGDEARLKGYRSEYMNRPKTKAEPAPAEEEPKADSPDAPTVTG